MGEIDQESRSTHNFNALSTFLYELGFYDHMTIFRKVALKIRMQILASLYAFKIVKNIIVKLMHFYHSAD